MSQKISSQKVNTSYFQNLANDFKRTLNDGQAVDIITFATANWGLNFKLFPMQKFILKSFYGMQLDKHQKNIVLNDFLNTKRIGTFTEHDFMQYLIDERKTNLTKYEPGNKRRQLVMCLGRRSSKSVMSSIIANYQTYRLVKMDNPQQYFGFPSGQQIAVTTVATTDEQATTLFDMIKARGVNCSFLKDRIANKTQTYFNLMTDQDVRKNGTPSIKLLCGGSGSASLRGKNNLIVIFDEAAFFLQGVKNSGEQIYNALTPSIASFTRNGVGQGKIILLSSPFSKSGLFYNKYIQSFQDQENMLMFQMYTAMVNPSVDSAFLRSEYRKNKDSFMCEFGAEFSDTISSWIDEKILKQAINKPQITQNRRVGDRSVSYYMGIDYGGKTDGTAISIVHKQGQNIILDYSEVFFSGSSDVWDTRNSIYKDCSKQFCGYQILPISGIADIIKNLCDKFNIVDGWFDQFNGYGLLQALKQRGLHQFRMQPMSNGLNTQIFQTSKMLINSGYVKLFNHPVLISQMITLQESKNGGSFVSVEAPQRTGFHDDISDSFCRAVWSCYNSNIKKGGNFISTSISSKSLYNNKSYQLHRMKKMRMHDDIFNIKNLGI